jgi:hypothetical protein
MAGSGTRIAFLRVSSVNATRTNIPGLSFRPWLGTRARSRMVRVFSSTTGSMA